MVAACVRNMVQVSRGEGICIVVIADRICQNTHIVKHNWCQLLFCTISWHRDAVIRFSYTIISKNNTNEKYDFLIFYYYSV